MTVTVFGATGRVGKYIVRMALAKGYNVKAFGRNIENLIDADLNNDKLETIKGFVFDETDVLKAVSGSDVIFSALGGGIDGTDKTRSLGIKNITEQMLKAGVKRILAVGGMGSLKDDEYEYRLNRPDYPAVFRAVSAEHFQAYQYLKVSDLDWTFVCPPDIKDGAATENYIISEEYKPVPYVNKIFAGDIADFMLKEAELNQYINKRVGICSL